MPTRSRSTARSAIRPKSARAWGSGSVETGRLRLRSALMGYAVQLYLDAELEAALLALRAALTKAGVTPTLERLGDRPHVSLAVLDDADVPRCVSVLERAASA